MRYGALLRTRGHFVNPNDASSTSQTRYVEHPVRRRAHRAAQRNLAWGIAFLFAALSVACFAVFIGGARAMIPILIGVLSFTALWVLARMKVFTQRNGVFFSLTIIALLAALAALVEQGAIHLANRSAIEPRVSTTAAPQPAMHAEPAVPSLIASLGLEPPETGLPRARATREVTTTIGGKTYRISPGDTFLFSDEKGGTITISAGEFLARVPADAMEVLAPAPSTPAVAKRDDPRSPLDKKIDAETTGRAQQEAARRFPGLARQGSAENKAFIEAVADLTRRNSELLDDPEWPVQLAEVLGRRLGWAEAGEDMPAPVLESKLAPGTQVLAPEPAEPGIPPPPQAPIR